MSGKIRVNSCKRSKIQTNRPNAGHKQKQSQTPVDVKPNNSSPKPAETTKPKSPVKTSETKTGVISVAALTSEVKTEVTTNKNIKTPARYRRLFDAVLRNDANEISRMLKVDKLDVNIVDEDDVLEPTPLLIAYEHQLVDAARALFKAKPKPDVNKANKKGRRPIWWAAKHGNKELTEMLIYDGKEDCEVNILDEESGLEGTWYRCTPLYRAVLSDSPEVCRLLVHAGADVNLRRLWKNTGESEIAESPLVKAVQMGSYEICDILINSMCKIQAKTEAGFTALHYAVGYRRYKIVDLLLENQIRVNARSRQGVTAMTIAIREQLPVMCRKLIEWGYDLDRKFKWDETPLEMAIRIHAESCAMILVQWGARIIKDRTFWMFRRPNEPPTIFRRAVEEGLLRLARILLVVFPYFFYEHWIRRDQFPVAVYTKADFCKWLLAECTKVRPLRELCTASVFRYLGRYSCKRLEELPVPDKIKDYFRLDRYFTDKMLREKTLTDHECPFYCVSRCPRQPQCPELDFSDSASDSD